MKYLYFLIPLSLWGVLIFINIIMTINEKHLANFKYGMMPVEFPFICAVLHMFFGYLVAFSLIMTIRSKKMAVLIFFVLLLIGTTLAFLNYKVFSNILLCLSPNCRKIWPIFF